MFLNNEIVTHCKTVLIHMCLHHRFAVTKQITSAVVKMGVSYTFHQAVYCLLNNMNMKEYGILNISLYTCTNVYIYTTRNLWVTSVSSVIFPKDSVSCYVLVYLCNDIVIEITG